MRKVKSERLRYRSLGLLLLWSLLLLTGCSDDSDKDALRQRVTIEVAPCAMPMEDVQPQGQVTRAWTPPQGYYLYDNVNVNGQFSQQKSMTNKTIKAFFTKDGASPWEGTFSYISSQTKWELNIDDFTPEDFSFGSYFLYGFIPSEVANSSSVRGNDTYADGAVLTINDLDAVTPSDVCVIVGAKDGTSEDNDNGLQTGQFATNLKSSEQHNYIFLLFDHLYSALRFRFSVDDTYDKLRTIKLRDLELKACGSNEYSAVKAKYNAEIRLKKTTDNSSPIESVTFIPDGGSSNIGYKNIFHGVTELSTTYPASYMGCFVTGSSSYFELRSTYDVYDKASPTPNLIREGCKAVNKLDLVDIFKEHVVLNRGQMYTVNLKVQPTYLYVLSDPDLDAPTIKIVN